MRSQGKKGTAKRLQMFAERERRRMHPRFTSAWDDLTWRVSGTKNVSDRQRRQIYFTTHGPRSGAGELMAFEAPFADFARAICNKYTERRRLTRPGSPTTIEQLVTALRFLHGALPQGNKDPTRLKPFDFIAAETAVGTQLGYGSYADVIIGKLEEVGTIMDRERLTAPRLRWRRSGKPVNVDRTAQTESDEQILAKLLTDDEMYAWAKLSADPGPDPLDRLRQRLVDLMICGAFRINEAMTLPLDTLVKARAYDGDGNALAKPSGEPVIRYGLRYWPHKGNDGACLVKWIPTVMAPIAERAITEVKAITRRARAVAQAFYEGTTPFNEDPWDSLNPVYDYSLTCENVGWMLGATRHQQRAGRTFIQVNKLATHRIAVDPDDLLPGGRPYLKAISKSQLEATLKAKSFDKYDGECKHGVIPMHECLFVFPYNMERGHPGFDGTAQLIWSGSVRLYLEDKYPRLSALASPGEIMTGHKFRRWLGTMARRGGLPHLDLSIWLGHAEVQSTYAYDLRPPSEKAENLRQWLAAMSATEEDDSIDVAEPQPFDSPLEEGVTGHATALGVCSHDYQSPPCPAFERSLAAPDAAILLQNLKTSELTALANRLTTLDGQAKATVGEGVFEAKAWVTVNERWRLKVETEIKRRSQQQESDGAEAA